MPECMQAHQKKIQYGIDLEYTLIKMFKATIGCPPQILHVL